MKTSDGDSWYNALIFEHSQAFGIGLTFQSSYTFSRNIDTTQGSVFFSDATNAHDGRHARSFPVSTTTKAWRIITPHTSG